MGAHSARKLRKAVSLSGVSVDWRYVIILGLANGIHDPAACLIVDGHVVAAVEEERLTRRKHGMGQHPTLAARYCLSRAGVELSDVDYVVWSWSPTPRESVTVYDRQPVELTDLYEATFDPGLFPSSSRRPTFAAVNHHLAHAASAYRCSGFSKAAIITLDGRGESEAGSVSLADNGEIQRLQTITIPSSVGALYSAATNFLGLSYGSEGTLMALAAMGQPKYSFDRIKFDDDGYHVDWPAAMPRTDDASTHGNLFWDAFHGWQADMAHILGEKWSPRKWLREDQLRPQTDDVVPAPYLDLAASVQRTLEDVYIHLVKMSTADDPTRPLCVAGGTALNCTMNGKVAASKMVPEMFVQPASSDAGGALGAALELAHHLGAPADYTMHDAYLGPDFADSDVEAALQATGTSYRSTQDPAARAAELIARGRVVGWFQGRAEFGPRALGARSILANPGQAGTKSHLNERVKHRARFRPFAISALSEHASDLVDYDSDSPFMLLGLPVKPEAKSSIVEATHVDDTTRPQTVDSHVAPTYWRLIEAFRSVTGIPAVLNTSFNDETEPIVCTPHDALRTFASTPLDDLIIGSFWVSKSP